MEYGEENLPSASTAQEIMPLRKSMKSEAMPTAPAMMPNALRVCQ